MPTWIPLHNNLRYFWSTSHTNTSYQVSSQFAFGFRRRMSKYIFLMAAVVFWSLHFQLLFIYKSPWYFLPSFKSIGNLVQEKKFKIAIQDCSHGSHPRYLIKMISVFLLDLQVALDTSYHLSDKWDIPFRNRFSRWQWLIFIRKDFSQLPRYFLPSF